LAREYQNTIASATGDSAKQIQPSGQVDATNAADVAARNAQAWAPESLPVGISRFAVRGLSASQRASTMRLKAIAALRANTIASTIQRMRIGSTGRSAAASSAPTSANGSANTEWLTRMNEA
jgi:hypothetical protein